LFHALALLAAPAWLGSCSSMSSSSYSAPPTSVRSSSMMQARHAPTAVLIVGDFENPKQSQLNWRDLGPGMSEALSRALLDRGRYDVIIKPTLSRRLQELVGQRSPESDPSLAEVRREHPEVDYVIIGAVTDFHHTGDLPLEIRPKTWLGNPRSDAIVAIDLVVVDLHNERLVAAEHITGTAPAGKTPTRTLYRDVAFGSYIFWNTPLGQAARSAIGRAVARVDSLVPGTPGMPTHAGKSFGSARVAQMISLRGVAIVGGRNCGLISEQIYALLPVGATADDAGLLRDQSTGRLLLVKIDESRDAEATGWLLGKCSDPRLVINAALRPVPGSTGDPAGMTRSPRTMPLDAPLDEANATATPASAASAVTHAGGGNSPD
jgi:curli biogenesis system outer membrane secretion channel CsgG